MADPEKTLLEFYQLTTPFPSEWPAKKDAGWSSGEEYGKTKRKKRQSRYQALESAINTRRSVPTGTEAGQRGVGNLVQKDEPDPLGTTDSVVRSLKQKGVPLQDDPRLRNRFLLSSTTFSPSLFLSQMHAQADTQSLLQGLETLSRSIDQKSASLKVLVETNFERFVRAKATIDNVYTEMKFCEEESSQFRGSRHARRASRASSGQVGFGSSSIPSSVECRKKNALVKESEYGVLGIKTPLLNVAAKAEELWGPALGGRDREEHLKAISEQLDSYSDCLQLSSSLCDSIKHKDFASIVEAYNRARKLADEARSLAQDLGGKSLEDAQLYRLVLTGRMWIDVDQQIQTFRRDMWKKLISLHTTPITGYRANGTREQHMDIISLLLELGVDDNPIWVWLLSRYDHLKGLIQATAERSKVEIEVLRRRLANGEKPAPQNIATYLKSLSRPAGHGKISSSDSPEVIELWEKMLAFLAGLLSPNGVLEELVEFWKTAQGFISGTTQKALPLGYEGESRCHHELSQQVIGDLEKGVVELVELLREHVYAFFASLPPEDISLLFSPVLPPPNSPASAGGLSPSALRDPRFNLDPKNPPPPSPKRGEAWEKLAFWPPWSNSLSAVHYLARMLALVGSGASDMAAIGPVTTGNPQVMDNLKILVGASRERCVTALCAAWNRDAEDVKHVEDWHRSTSFSDVTKMPSSFSTFESALLSGMQKLLYIPEAREKSGAANIVLPPPPKLLQMVRSQYVTTLYKALSGMVENAERHLKKGEDEWAVSPGDWQSATSVSLLTERRALDASDRNVRMLLTLSNLQALRSQVVPSLNTQFENDFSVKLTEESKTIRDVLGQIDARLFQSYTKQHIDKLREIIQAGLSAPDWEPAAQERPHTAKPYVHDALLTLVLVHSQVSTVAASLTPQVLSFLLEQSYIQLLDAFRKRSRYSLEALMQATLDVEFIGQTLSQYTTDHASELQIQIYHELDSRTDNDARARLQGELPEMRSMLKKLRDAIKSEFACFKKLKRPGQAAARSGSSGTVT